MAIQTVENSKTEDYWKSGFLSFTAKVNPDNGNKTKSDIFPSDKFKLVVMFFLDKKYWTIPMTFKIKVS